ncbi:uncharacterized protein LOC141685137 [Apium graveolens]|uniref:uncharacterized protein LOC141685137 n=1 Tax=Apium graveolens TaxID=4045 RepID=UPI003D7A07B6
MATNRLSFTDLQNPLFLHPSDGPTSISVPKLQGAGDYRTWKRSFEIQLSAKRKLGFVDGSVTRNTTDLAEASQWDTCNNMVISWLHNNISDNIKSSVLFINTAYDIWKQLEKRFLLTNGSRKYKLNKDLFSLKQNGMKINEYFTCLSGLWEEIESMNVLPAVNTVTPEVAKLLRAIDDLKEEAKLFQFLNGLDDMYGAQRSQLLMMVPLSSVETACSAVQQEESQKELLTHNGVGESDVMAMYSRGNVERNMQCTNCGRRGHSNDKCWGVTGGYPKWHYKHKPGGQRGATGKWSGNKPNYPKMANNAHGVTAEQNGIMMTAQQFDRILKLIPQGSSMSQKESETDEEIDYGFSGMVSTVKNKKMGFEWIIDSGESDYMTSSLGNLMNVKPAPATFTINLPTGATTHITHIGDAVLPNSLKLTNVLFVPQFNHNLLSIHKLAQDSGCDVMFRPNNCVIIDSSSKKVLGKGELRQGLYYLKCDNMATQGAAMTGQKEKKGKMISINSLFGINAWAMPQYQKWNILLVSNHLYHRRKNRYVSLVHYQK